MTDEEAVVAALAEKAQEDDVDGFTALLAAAVKAGHPQGVWHGSQELPYRAACGRASMSVLGWMLADGRGEGVDLYGGHDSNEDSSGMHPEVEEAMTDIGLERAAKHGHIAVLQLHLDMLGADAMKGFPGMLQHTAAFFGHVHFYERLQQLGKELGEPLNVNHASYTMGTPLACAAAGQQEDMVEFLLALPNLQYPIGLGPVSAAASTGDAGILRRLLQTFTTGKVGNVHTWPEGHPLEAASQAGSVECFELLRSPPLNLRLSRGQVPGCLLAAVKGPLHSNSESTDLLRVLLSLEGEEAPIPSDIDGVILFSVSREGAWRGVEVLLEALGSAVREPFLRGCQLQALASVRLQPPASDGSGARNSVKCLEALLRDGRWCMDLAHCVYFAYAAAQAAAFLLDRGIDVGPCSADFFLHWVRTCCEVQGGGGSARAVLTQPPLPHGAYVAATEAPPGDLRIQQLTPRPPRFVPFEAQPPLTEPAAWAPEEVQDLVAEAWPAIATLARELTWTRRRRLLLTRREVGSP